MMRRLAQGIFEGVGGELLRSKKSIIFSGLSVIGSFLSFTKTLNRSYWILPVEIDT